MKSLTFNLMFLLQEISRTYYQVNLLISNINAEQIAKYWRREYIDTVDIFSGVKYKKLEESVADIFDKLCCSTDADYTEACNRVSKANKTVILKFTKSKIKIIKTNIRLYTYY